MAQRLKVLTTFLEDQSLVPSTHNRKLTTTCNTSSRGIWYHLPSSEGTYNVLTYIQTDRHTDRQTCIQTDRHTHTHTEVCLENKSLMIKRTQRWVHSVGLLHPQVTYLTTQPWTEQNMFFRKYLFLPSLFSKRVWFHSSFTVCCVLNNTQWFKECGRWCRLCPNTVYIHIQKRLVPLQILLFSPHRILGATMLIEEKHVFWNPSSLFTFTFVSTNLLLPHRYLKNGKRCSRGSLSNCRDLTRGQGWFPIKPEYHMSSALNCMGSHGSFWEPATYCPSPGSWVAATYLCMWPLLWQSLRHPWFSELYPWICLLNIHLIPKS